MTLFLTHFYSQKSNSIVFSAFDDFPVYHFELFNIRKIQNPARKIFFHLYIPEYSKTFSQDLGMKLQSDIDLHCFFYPYATKINWQKGWEGRISNKGSQNKKVYVSGKVRGNT